MRIISIEWLALPPGAELLDVPEDEKDSSDDTVVSNSSVVPLSVGEIIKNLYLLRRQISIAKFAEIVGMSRKHVNDIINRDHGIGPEAAIKIGGAIGLDPVFLIALQARRDVFIERVSHPSKYINSNRSIWSPVSQQAVKGEGIAPPQQSPSEA